MTMNFFLKGVFRPHRELLYPLDPLYNLWKMQNIKNVNFNLAMVKMCSNQPKRNTKDIRMRIGKVLRTLLRTLLRAQSENMVIFRKKQPFGAKRCPWGL